MTLVGYGREIKKIAKSKPAEHDLPFSTWNLAKLADFLVAEGWSMTSATRACGTDHASHKEQASMIRRYIIWRNNMPTTNDSAASSTRQT